MHFNAKWPKNGQKQAKNKGTPYPGMPLYLIIYSSGKEPQPYLLNFVNQKSDFT